ncbi:MAG TPA: hypothetical protein VGB51_10700 [Actinomycetota bacterium]
MKRLTIFVLLAGVVASAATPGAANGPQREGAAEQRLPFEFFMTHYELLGDPDDPSGVRYHSNGEPFALAPDGSRVLISGNGSWDPASGRVRGGGQYVIRKGGQVQASGDWQPIEFVSFRMLAGWWGIPGWKEKGWQGSPGSASFSGFLRMRVELEGMGQGLLTVWCLMPEVRMPGDHISDGITLTGGPFNFSDYHKTERSFEGAMFYGP